MNATQRLVLGVLLAAEPAARVGREDAHLRRAASRGARRSTRWSQFGCWIELQIAIPSPSGAAMKACGSIANWVTIGKRVGALDDDVRLARGRVDVAPAVVVLAQDVGRRERVAGAERRVLDERRGRVERGGDRDDRRERLELDADERGGLLGGVAGLGRDRRDRLAVVVRLADGEHRPVAELRPEPRHRVGQVGGASSRGGRPGRRAPRVVSIAADPRPGARRP